MNARSTGLDEEALGVTIDCGPGYDFVALDPTKRGTYRNCEAFDDQFHELDFQGLFRPSPEIRPEAGPADRPDSCNPA